MNETNLKHKRTKAGHQASRWFVKLRSGAVTPKLDRQFRRWLRSDPVNESAYERCELSLTLARELENDPELSSLLRECSALSEEYKAGKPGIMGTISNWLMGYQRMAATAALVMLAVGLSLLWQAQPVMYETAIGEQRTIVLTDNSTVELNTNTEIAVDYDTNSRQIRLIRGEAFFEVAHNPDRPFEVLAGNGVVTAIGTAFGVSLENSRVTVSVLEGIVAVAPLAKSSDSPLNEIPVPQRLHVNESINYWNSGVVAEVQVADKNRINAWRQGKLNYDNLRLADAIREHNRYTTKKIILGSDEIKNLTISGVLHIGDTDSLVYLLEQSLGLRSIRKSEIILLVKPSTSHIVTDKPSDIDKDAS